jgi:hypothetical protein
VSPYRHEVVVFEGGCSAWDVRIRIWRRTEGGVSIFAACKPEKDEEEAIATYISKWNLGMAVI